MNKSVTWKIILIAVLVVVAAWTLYPPDKTLKPGIDLAGGTSLIYQINTQGLKEKDKEGLSQRMINVLRRRTDPANIQNLIWLPLGNTRFEIRMPLASEEARLKRQKYERALTSLLGENVNKAVVMRALQIPAKEREEKFNGFAHEDPNKLEILQTLAKVYDERKELQSKRDNFDEELKTTEKQITSAGLSLDEVKQNRSSWVKLNEQELQDSLKEFTDANDNVKLLTGYVKTYSERANALNQLNEPDTGVNARYADATKEIDQLNLTKEQLDRCLDIGPKSSRRRLAIEELKAKFQDRADKIDKVEAAFDGYRPFQGRLDDPKDLQRMLKGAGVLEFRILPTQGHGETDPDLIATYVETLKEKGPKYTLEDKKYVWCEIDKEELNDWLRADAQGNVYIMVKDNDDGLAIVGQFGDKFYVLASNNPEDVMLHKTIQTADVRKKWKLEDARQAVDRMGRRAIGFTLNEWGGKQFYKVTSKNKYRPLCILLDGIAISAPNIESEIRRQGIITGSFTETEQKDMIDKLSAGSLPAMLIEQPISVNTIGPSIGADNRDQGIKAGLIGLVVVLACMLIYYLLSGATADVALLMNILFVLAIMAGVRATFTLPGIAGIILTIGMSVDANVLIFERIREEQQKGSSLRIAIANGYQRAFRTILDANLTTFITAAILYWVASEEIKGFAIVLMLGIASSMFTALFVTRVILDWLLARRIIKERLVMLRLIHKPNVNWMRARPIFFCISILLIAGGVFAFISRTDKYDIEFTGGTAATITLKDEMELTRQEVEDKIRTVLAGANVYSVGKPIDKPLEETPEGEKIYRQYEINTNETNKIIVTATFLQAGEKTVSELSDAIEKAQEQFAGKLTNLVVTQDANNPANFTITTSQMNQSLVKEVLETAFADAEISELNVAETVNNAILAAFVDENGESQLEVQQNLRPKISSKKISETLVDSYPELADFLGGIKIACELELAATISEIDQRLRDLQFKPDTQDLVRYDYRILGSDLNPITDANETVKSFVYISAEEEAGLREQSDEDEQWTLFAENEKTKVLAATQLETSLPRVRQFDPSVGEEQWQLALIAIVLSLSAIVTYIWVRFGNVRYGIAAIVALVHDVCITLGAVTACTYIAASPIGEKLLIGDFKINLAMIAAFLTLIGYSLNDTIVVFDRIRENRGKNRPINPQIITNSINQTISRTILTSFTTFIVVLIMYIFGGAGLRGFTFAIGFGIIIGTYSSIAIAAPILLLGAKTKTEKGKK